MLMPCDGIFAPSWLASVSINTLKKIYPSEHIFNLNIPQICEKQRLSIMHSYNGGNKRGKIANNDDCALPRSSMPLRLHSNLLVGTARIFEQQVDNLLADCANLCFVSKTQNFATKQRSAPVMKRSRKGKRNVNDIKCRDLTSNDFDNQHDLEKENLSGQYYSQLMRDVYDDLQSAASQPIVINTNVNVQIHSITLEDTANEMCLSNVDLMSHNEDSFDNALDTEINNFNDEFDLDNNNNNICNVREIEGSNIIEQESHLNEYIDNLPSTSRNLRNNIISTPVPAKNINKNLLSCDGNDLKDKNPLNKVFDVNDCIDNLSSTSKNNMHQVQIYKPPRVPAKTLIISKCKRKRKANNSQKISCKKRHLNAEATKQEDMSKMLKPVKPVKRRHTSTNSLSLDQDDILPNKRILREINVNDINNNIENINNNECLNNSSEFHEDHDANIGLPEMDEPGKICNKTYMQEIEKWQPAGVFKMLYAIWRTFPNDASTLQMVDAKVFFAAANTRVCAALGFSSLMELVKSRLVSIKTNENSIEVRYLLKGTLFHFLFQKN